MSKEIRYETFEYVDSYEDERVVAMVPVIIEAIRDAFGRPDFEENDILAHIRGDLMILGMLANEVVSYSTLEFGPMGELLGDESFGDEEVGYLAAGLVVQAEQGNGLYAELNRMRLEEVRTRGLKTVVTRTQNPVVESGLRRAMTEMVGEEFVVERHSLPGFYGRQLTGEVLESMDSEVQAVYDEIDYQAGDAYVLIYRMEK